MIGDGTDNTLSVVPLNDTLSGRGGNDSLKGLAGNDYLDGGPGADIMIGGTGNDTYVVDNSGDVVTENSGAGFTLPSGWALKGTADLDKDGQLDVVVTNGASMNQLRLLKNGAVSQTIAVDFYSNWALAGVGDFNGDGNKDVLYVGANGAEAYQPWAGAIDRERGETVSGATLD